MSNEPMSHLTSREIEALLTEPVYWFGREVDIRLGTLWVYDTLWHVIRVRANEQHFAVSMPERSDAIRAMYDHVGHEWAVCFEDWPTDPPLPWPYKL